MNEKLPEMYRGNIKSDTDNNERVFSTLNRDSSDYIYKADVTIVTDKGTFKKRIIGKSGGNLLTFDNEKIRISDIRDIYR